jgi:hypothetical protein
MFCTKWEINFGFDSERMCYKNTFRTREKRKAVLSFVYNKHTSRGKIVDDFTSTCFYFFEKGDKISLILLIFVCILVKMELITKLLLKNEMLYIFLVFNGKVDC